MPHRFVVERWGKRDGGGRERGLCVRVHSGQGLRRDNKVGPGARKEC